MHELFDMISGSETGAIIAATLVTPKAKGHAGEVNGQKNKYWATRAASFFKENVDLLYVDQKMPESLKAFLTVLFLIIVGFITYKAAETYFKNDGKSIQLAEIKKLVRLKKKLLKNKNIDKDELEKCENDCEKLIGAEKDIMVIALYNEVKSIDSHDPSKMDTLFKTKATIDKLERQRRKNQGLKWYFMLFGTLLMGVM